MNEYLFIGGPADGVHLKTNGASYHVVALDVNQTLRIPLEEGSFKDFAYDRFHYTKNRIPGTAMFVYAPEDWEWEKIAATIIRRYPKPL